MEIEVGLDDRRTNIRRLIYIPGSGYQIVKTLASLRSDYQILLGCNDVHDGEIAASSLGAPVNVNPIQLDLSNDQSIDHAVKAVEQHFGRIDILINNASFTGQETAHHDSSCRKTWQQVFDTNVVGTALLTDHCISLLEHSSSPKIIFISDASASSSQVLKAGLSKPTAAQSSIALSSSMAAVNRIAVHYATQYPKIRVNVSAASSDPTTIEEGDLGDGFDASDAIRLATEKGGDTATFTSKDGTLSW